MKTVSQETMPFNEGFIESFIENYQSQMDPNAPQMVKDEADELLEVWRRFTLQIQTLRKELNDAEMKLFAARQALL